MGMLAHLAVAFFCLHYQTEKAFPHFSEKEVSDALSPTPSPIIKERKSK